MHMAALADVSNEEIVDVSSQMDEEDRGDFNVENISSSLSSSSSSRSASRMGEESIEVGEEQAQHPSPVCRKRKINPREDVPEEEDKPRCVLMSVYEEHELLKKLEKLGSVVDNHPVAKRLRRKLLVRQKQRALNLPLFDLDAFMRQESLEQKANFPEMAASPSNFLDRYMMSGYNLVARSHVNFLTRLMGLEEEQMESTTSPYTLRCLKPFIFRDYETVPLKLKLLQEIFSYPHRKIVIGFAFMVPDVSYNEAYISFIFTHPEWRNAGIATFMLYHLIQTCMGKDVTLHVSATNPACFLYQKFGFKVEEFIVDFYNKYLPVTSKDCRNALFLRLSR